MANARDVELNLVGNDRTDRATRGAAANLDQLARRMDKFNVDTKRSMVGGGAAAAVGFVKSFGSAVSSLGKVAMPIAVAALIKTAYVALQAGLPLLLGAGLLAGPLIYLAKTQAKASEQAKKHATKIESIKKRIAASDDKDIKKRLRSELTFHTKAMANAEKQAHSFDRLKGRAKGFMDYISKPLKVPFQKTLEAIGDGLDDMKKPVRDVMKALAPLLVPAAKSVMTALKDFFVGLKPSLPAITAGFTSLMGSLPTVAKALTDMINAILKDPEQVNKSVSTMTQWMSTIARLAPLVIGLLNFMTHGLGRFGNALYVGGAAAMAFQRAWRFVTSRVKAAWSSLKENMSQVGADIKRAWFKIVSTALSMAKGVLRGFAMMLRGVATVAEALGMKKAAANMRTAAGKIDAQADRIQRRINALHGKTIRVVTKFITLGTPVSVMGRSAKRTSISVNTPQSWSSGNTWSSALGGSGNGFRVAPATPVVNMGDTNVAVRAFIDGRELRTMVRSTITDESKRNAHRARVGRR